MTTFKAGRVFVDPFGLLMINTFMPDPATQNLQTQRNIVWDATDAKCVNFPRLTPDMSFTLILYDPTAVRDVPNNYSKYTGELYVLPLDKRLFSHEVEMDDAIAIVRIFIMVKSDTAHTVTGRFWGRKIEFFYPRHDVPLILLRGILARTFNGEGTVFEVITPALFDDIPVNHPTSGTEMPVNTELRGSEMETYKIPFAKMGTTFNLSNFGRPLDWSASFEQNKITKDEVIFCDLYRPGNNLLSYPGSAKPDWGYMGFDTFLEVVFNYVGPKL